MVDKPIMMTFEFPEGFASSLIAIGYCFNERPVWYLFFHNNIQLKINSRFIKIKNSKRHIKLLSDSISQNYFVNVRVQAYNWPSKTFFALNLFIANGFLYSLHLAI